MVSTLRQGPADDHTAARAIVSSSLFPGSNSLGFLSGELTGNAWSGLSIPTSIDPADFYQAEVYGNWTVGGTNLKLRASLRP